MTIPTLPASISLLAPIQSGLLLAATAGAGSFRVHGQRVRVGGIQRDPRSAIEIDGRLVARGVQAVPGAVVNIILHPGLTRREIAGPTGICLETIVAAPSLPFAAVQWSAAGAGAPTEVAFEIPGDLAHFEAKEEAGIVRTVGEEARSVVVGLAGGGGSRSVQVTASEPGWVSVRWTELTGTPLTLVVAAGSPSEVKSALAASGHLQGHANRAAQSPVPDGLTLSTGVEEIDDGVAWAIARVHAAARLASDDEAPLPRLLAGLAAIAANDAESTEDLLQAGEGLGDSVHGLLAATSALATGRSGAAARVARSWIAAGSPKGTDTLSLADTAFGRLADALRHGAPDEVIADLRSCVGRGRPSASSTGGRLPMVGKAGGGRAGWGSWIDGLLSGDPGGEIPPSTRSDVMIARRSTATFTRDPDAAWVEWRQLLASGISGGRLAEWDLDAASPDGSRGDPHFDGVPSEIVLALVHGLLGYSPDAPVGRVRIAPRLPAHLTSFTVTGLGVGDTSLTMKYERAHGLHRFTLDPVLAAVPPLAVFEAAVEGEVRAVRVDGAPAELDTRPSGTRTTVPIQIPVDSPRTIEIEVREDG